MSIRQFNPATSPSQSNLQDFARQLTNNPLLSGNLIADITPVLGLNKIAHNLGKPAIGYIVVKVTDGNVTGSYISSSNNSNTETYLNLYLNGTITTNTRVSIWVF